VAGRVLNAKPNLQCSGHIIPRDQNDDPRVNDSRLFKTSRAHSTSVAAPHSMTGFSLITTTNGGMA
jgi:hypothetical protein